MKPVAIATILRFLESEIFDYEVVGHNRMVSPQQISLANINNFSFVTESFIKDGLGGPLSRADYVGLVIGPLGLSKEFTFAENWISVEDPRNTFALVCLEFFPTSAPSISMSGNSASGIRPRLFRFLETSGRGNGSGGPFIDPWVTLGSECRIGRGTVIGGDGFGFVSGREGLNTRFPHYGGVTIGNRCEIGSNCTVDRAVFGNTVIENDVKIDNLVHIAHNVRIGENSLIAAGVVISGSVKVGKNVWIGPGATLSDNISIGDGARIGIGAVVIRPVEAGEKVFGNPARAH